MHSGCGLDVVWMQSACGHDAINLGQLRIILVNLGQLGSTWVKLDQLESTWINMDQLGSLSIILRALYHNTLKTC